MIPVPRVPGAFLLTDVLSISECRSILASAEAVGFVPDQPVGDQGASVLAHVRLIPLICTSPVLRFIAQNLYWLADESFLSTFCSRFLHLVPQVLNGGKVTGLNARFRGKIRSFAIEYHVAKPSFVLVYRYVPGAIYRPHIDGAWPRSGVDPVTVGLLLLISHRTQGFPA